MAMLTRTSATLAAAWLLTAASPSAQSALFSVDLFTPGDALLTRDTDTGLDWLDLTETKGLSYDAIAGGNGGWIALGFGFANLDHVRTLFQNAGIVNLGGESVPGNYQGVTLLMGLLGQTYTGLFGSRDSSGLADLVPFSETSVGSGFLHLSPFGPSASAGISDFFQTPKTTASPISGVFLIRTATPPSTLSFNPAGVGHILIVPYFSTQDGNATLLNIVNTDTVNGKAVKIRFRGASNSDDVFDFQLFLSPADVWTANISKGASGLSRLETGDKSCTLPANVNQDFITSRLNTVDLSGDALANETREGYVEILTMGDIPSVSGTTSVWFATKHNSAGVAPCTASILESLSIADTRLNNPTTGLFANWTIINVPQTTTWTGEAAAIEARTSTGAAGKGNNVYWPQTAVALTGPEIDANTADPLLVGRFIEAARYDLPDLSTPYTIGATAIAQANELSDALAATQVAGEFLSTPGLSASTDWVVSKPTRRYYAAVDYEGLTPAQKLVTNYDDNGIALAVYYRESNTTMGNAVNGGKSYQACTQVTSLKFWNREEVSPTSSGIVISPGQPTPIPSLCAEVSVLGVNSPTSPLGASVSRFNATVAAGNEGWGLLTANNPFGGQNLGLPMLVTQFTKATNPAVAAGVSSTFGAAWAGRVVQRGARY